MSASSPGRDRNFNPLSAWLGFPANALPRDYYSLLGLELYESNIHEINRAAETLIAHVREIRPGPYLTEWTQLLDILRTAKACLCDPDKKRAYDEALRSHRVHSLLPDSWLPSDTLPGVTDAFAGSDVPSSSVMSATLPVSEEREPALESRSDGTETIHLDLSGIPVWRRRTSSTLVRVCALCLLVLAIVVAYQMMTAPEWWRPRLRALVSLSSGGPEKLKSASESLPESPSIISERQPKEIASAGALPQPEANRPEQRDDGKPTTHSPDRNDLVHSQELDDIDSQAETPVMPVSQTSAFSEPSESPEDPNDALPPPGLPGHQSAEEPASQLQGQQGQDGSQQNEMASAGERFPNESPSNEGLRAEFRELTDELWQAMSKRELEIARSTLNRLAAEVRNESERRAVESLDYLLRHVEEFWRALSRIVPSMKAGEEMAVGDTYIVVVDATADELVIRAAGQNRRYRIQEMPTPLIRLIVARRFRPGPETDAVFGAFLAVDPRGDPGEAEKLWRRADDDVLDADLLIEALKFRPSHVGQ